MWAVDYEYKCNSYKSLVRKVNMKGFSFCPPQLVSIKVAHLLTVVSTAWLVVSLSFIDKILEKIVAN